jgi:hypothetical protein
VLFRSLRPLAGRALAAGAASALALTLFNAAQPSLSARRVHPGTLKMVRVPSPRSQPRPLLQARLPRRLLPQARLFRRPELWPRPRPLHWPGLWPRPLPRPGLWPRPPCGQRRAPHFRVGYAPPPGARAGSRVGEGRPGDADAVRAGGGGQGAVRGVLVAGPGSFGGHGRGGALAAGPDHGRPPTAPTRPAVSTGWDGSTATANGWTPVPPRSRSGSTHRPPPTPRSRGRPPRPGPQPCRRAGWRRI